LVPLHDQGELVAVGAAVGAAVGLVGAGDAIGAAGFSILGK